MLNTDNNRTVGYIKFVREEENKFLQMFGEEELKKAKEECKRQPISYVAYLRWKTQELIKAKMEEGTCDSSGGIKSETFR